jgi:hypothetical protein
MIRNWMHDEISLFLILKPPELQVSSKFYIRTIGSGTKCPRPRIANHSDEQYKRVHSANGIGELCMSKHSQSCTEEIRKHITGLGQADLL